jgi:uncharacterized repeat protein (TIGR03803 family)
MPRLPGFQPQRHVVSAAVAALIALPRLAGAQATVEVVHTFTGVVAPSAPVNLIQATDGNFYGISRYNGTAAIARLTPAGRISIVHALTAAEGTSITALLQASDGNFYGATSDGGTSSVGTIFRVMPDGTFSIVHHFSGRPHVGDPGDNDGAGPTALVQGIDGNLYGLTSGGGSVPNGSGTFFTMTLGGTVSVLHSFQFTELFLPATLMQASDGTFYGGNGQSTLFKATSGGAVSILTQASPATGSDFFPSTMIESPDGNLYGTTAGNCGIVILCAGGEAFKLSPAGQVTVIHTFERFSSPNAALVQSGGMFYGTTSTSVFKMTASGVVTVLHTFAGTAEDGSGPTHLVRSGDGSLYGTTSSGGSLSLGTMFRIGADDTFTRIATSFVDGPAGGAVPTAALLKAADGDFYGTTSGGGTFGLGAIFKLTAAGGFSILHSFAGGADGAGPYAALVQATDGNFYGTTYYGGSANNGTIFQMTAAGVVTIVHRFAGGTEGAHPYAPLIQAADGRLYGTTFGSCSPVSCDPAAGGTIFRLPPGGPVTTLRHLDPNLEGTQPNAALVQGTDGNFYGSTTAGRSSGTIFRMTPDGAVTVLYNIDPRTNGYSPHGALVQGSDGNFYGAMTQGAAGATIFRITPAGSFKVVYAFGLGSGVGGSPEAPLIQAADGNLYGLARGGGVSGKGAIFQVSTDGNFFLMLHSFTGAADGGNPAGGLIQTPDGSLYGTTTTGGLGRGVIFRLSLTPQAPIIVKQPLDQTVKSGRRAVFTVDETGIPAPALQWQVSTNSGGSWTNVTNGGRYSGATTKNLTVAGSLSIDANQFRVVATNTIGSATSGAAVLTVRPNGIPDVDGDGKTDLVIFRPAGGNWFSRSMSGGTSSIQQWGLSGDVPVPGDYSGHGMLELAVYRPSTSTWYVLSPSFPINVGVPGFKLGVPGDIPVPGDYDGDGKTDMAVYHPSTGVWSIGTGTFTVTPTTVALGLSTDIPVPADYDGDGKTDVAVYRPSTGMWYVRQSSDGAGLSLQWGLGGDVPVPGDYDGDGVADLAVYRPATGMWYIRQSSTNFTTVVSYQWGLSADVAAPADYDGDGRIDLTLFRPATGEWFILQSTTGYTTPVIVQWGLPGDVPAPNAAIAYAMAATRGKATVSPLANLTRASDANGDGRADLVVFRPSTGTWFTDLIVANNPTPVSLGVSTDVPVTGDFDGDGRADLVIYTPSTGMWSIVESSLGTLVQYQWGLSGDVPVPGDYDGDGRTDLAVYRPSNGVWYIRQSSTNFTTFVSYQWGLSGDVTIPGDYDGDGVTDLAVYRPPTGEWFVRYSTTGYATSVTFQWGLGGDITVPGDYDGDGRTDLAVWRPSTGVWYVRYSSSNYATFATYQWGLSGDTPVPGDFDGDGKTDPAVWRPPSGVWYVLRSGTNFTTSDAVQWGLPGDVPILRRP